MSFLSRTPSFALSLLLTALAAGCSGGMGSTPPPTKTGNTTVNLLLTSSSNNHLSQFTLNFTGISLTSQSGKTVSLLVTPQNVEFMHLNGTTEPFVIVSVPQDV